VEGRIVERNVLADPARFGGSLAEAVE